MAFPFETSTLLITGANRGLGKAIAIELLEKNAKKVWCATRHQYVPDWFDELSKEKTEKVAHVFLDYQAPDSIVAAFDQVGDFDVLINNAAICKRSSISDISMNAMREEWETNFFGPMFMLKCAFQRVKRLKLFVNIGSKFLLDTPPEFPNYATTKTAFYLNSVAMSSELEDSGIKVQTFVPSAIDTDMGLASSSNKMPSALAAKTILHELGGKNLVFLSEDARNHFHQLVVGLNDYFFDESDRTS